MMARASSFLTFAFCLLPFALTAQAPQSRVFDRARGEFSSFEAMLDAAAKADVLFIGEQHDSAPTHAVELAILQGLAKRRGDLGLALEMFERDVQDPLDHFGMGHMSEEEFLKASRPWPRYATDYKPLVDFAIEKNMPVVAGNVPRPMASEVSKSGLDVLKSKSADEKKWFAADLQCPTNDDYFKRFGEAMGGHTAMADLQKFYFAQCLKDETMGESIANLWKTMAMGGKHPLVVHVNGAFHSDFAEGTVARAARRLPGKKIVVVSVVPLPNLNLLDTLTPNTAEQKRGNYIVYVSQK